MSGYDHDTLRWIGEMGYAAGCEFAQLEAQEGKQEGIFSQIAASFLVFAMTKGISVENETYKPFTREFLSGYMAEQCYEFETGYGTNSIQANS